MTMAKHKRDAAELSDSSDEEVLLRLGNIPSDWYDEFNHAGYDVTGNKVLKTKQNTISDILQHSKDKQWWKTIHDELNNRNIKLTPEELEMITRLRKGKTGTDNNEYGISISIPYADSIHPLSNAPEAKRKFLPSESERKMVNKLVYAMRMGFIKPKEEKPKEEAPWDIWKDESLKARPLGLPRKINAPKKPPPTNAESYNPPEEYLFDEEEKKEWEDADPNERKLNFMPSKYDSLRNVPLYDNNVKESFDRCVDLFYCPRTIRRRTNIDPDSIIPRLPDPKELKPFPTIKSILYEGHDCAVVSLSIDPTGFLLATANEKGKIIFYEVSTGRSLKEVNLECTLYDAQFSKNEETPIYAVCSEKGVYLYNTMLLENEKNSNIEKLFNEISVKEPWEKISGEMPTIFIPMEASPRSIAWHSKGDYFATVSSHLQASVSAQIIMHCLSKSQSQKPFKKNKGLIQAVAFHPFKAYFFVATQTNVFMYNLEKQLMAKKFYSGSKWISSICIHPSGNNFIVGTYDKKTIWFDVDYGSKPYKVLKYQSKAVRKVDIHSKYPIFASAADDGTVNIFHGMVYEDYSENALILPLNILDGHKTEKELGVMSMCFHPQQPWVFSGGADGKVILWV